MREEAKRQVQEAYAGAARFSGTVIAIVAALFAVFAIKNMVSQEPFGGQLLGAVFLGLMAAVLITARAGKPSDPQSQNQD
jgi:cadmium resistance protein CadD (predicted permease)